MEKDSIKDWSSSARSHWRTSFGKKGWLRPMVLGIIEREPMNGVELINRISEMSHGWWKPSPGSLYPLLQALCEEKILKKRGNGKYELTDKYKKEFGSNDETENILINIESEITYLEELSQSDKKGFERYKKKISELKEKLSGLK
jgi:DNA-binding PadR family transcriptional regulator